LTVGHHSRKDCLRAEIVHLRRRGLSSAATPFGRLCRARQMPPRHALRSGLAPGWRTGPAPRGTACTVGFESLGLDAVLQARSFRAARKAATLQAITVQVIGREDRAGK